MVKLILCHYWKTWAYFEHWFSQHCINYNVPMCLYFDDCANIKDYCEGITKYSIFVLLQVDLNLILLLLYRLFLFRRHLIFIFNIIVLLLLGNILFLISLLLIIVVVTSLCYWQRKQLYSRWRYSADGFIKSFCLKHNRVEARYFSLAKFSRQAVGPTQPPTQWVPGSLSPRVEWLGAWQRPFISRLYWS